MFNVPSFEIGAIGAALIAGLASLLGLVISKEQKTSEFRQAWVDALRNDLSNYLTQINAICDGVSINYKTIEKKVEALTPLYRELNKATFNIALRINPEEPLAKRVIASMGKLHKLTGDHSSISPDKIRPIESEMLSASQKLLKSEWKRVKTGEKTFVLAKFAALAVVVLSLLFGVAQLALKLNATQGTPKAPAIAPNTAPKTPSADKPGSKTDTLIRAPALKVPTTPPPP